MINKTKIKNKAPTKNKICAVLFSGGKDSCLALHKALQNGFNVKYLLSVFPENPDSFMFHKPDLKLLEKQAEMLGIELIVMGSKGEKEKELEDLEKLILRVSKDVGTIVVGGIASDYQGSRIKKICDDLGLEFYTPILGYSPNHVWKELFDSGFKVILTKRACEGLTDELLGVIIDKEKFKDMEKRSEKYKFRLDFEGGEAESAVLFMPEFAKEIKIKFKIIKQGSYNSYLDITKVN